MKNGGQVRTSVLSVGPKYVYVRLQGVVAEKNVIFIDREGGKEG